MSFKTINESKTLQSCSVRALLKLLLIDKCRLLCVLELYIGVDNIPLQCLDNGLQKKSCHKSQPSCTPTVLKFIHYATSMIINPSNASLLVAFVLEAIIKLIVIIKYGTIRPVSNAKTR